MKFNNNKVKLVIISVGQNNATNAYIQGINKACNSVGVEVINKIFSNEESRDNIIDFINYCNEEKHINGIIIQSPLPKHVNINRVSKYISIYKDVDCMHPYNVGLLNTSNPTFIPCTPKGILELLDDYKIQIEGKNCVVLGRSNIVGKPLSVLLTQRNGTVTLCHSKTENLKQICTAADILISSIGRPKFVTTDFIKENAVVIDVGFHVLNNGEICGDIDFENVKDKTSYITPVLSGVGSMTTTMLLKNVVKAYELQNYSSN